MTLTADALTKMTTAEIVAFLNGYGTGQEDDIIMLPMIEDVVVSITHRDTMAILAAFSDWQDRKIATNNETIAALAREAAQNEETEA